MSIFNESNSKKLKEILNELRNEVNVIYFTQEFECASCKETRLFLEEITALSDKLSLTIYDFQKDNEKAKEFGIDKIPAITILDNEKSDKGIKFYGAPGGYEINSFIASLLEVSGVAEELPRSVMERIRNIDKDIHIQVFVTLACPYCSGAVINAHRIALESNKVKADMIESSTYPHLAQRYNVTGVPKIVINEEYDLIGAQAIESILELIDKI